MLGIFVELVVVFESPEALHLGDLHPGQSLPLAGPQRHDFASEGVLVAHLGLLGKLLLQSFDLILFGVEEGVAPPPLGINGLLFL